MLAVVALGATLSALAQTGPFDPEDWPPGINPDVFVDYVVTDEGLPPPNFNWEPDSLIILTGGDQITEDTQIGGHIGKKVIGNFLNVADRYYEDWADDEFIDILIQVYGNEALLDASGQARDYIFLTGTQPDLNFPVLEEAIPVEAKNGKWNWFLFRVPNEIRPSDGGRYVGPLAPNATGGIAYGGVNGGTIRFEAVPGLIVRAIAFGPQGAFGEPEQINLFFPPDACDPEPETNLAGIDIATDQADHVLVLDDGNQTVTYQDDAGPTGDQRRAVAPTGQYLNFGITDEYLGKPCNDPRLVKVCLEFYDDPAFAGAGVRFGPEAYATDSLGGTGSLPEASRHTMQGTDTWIRRSWSINAVNLKGVDAGIYTAGPRFISENAPVFVSRFQVAVLRTGDHPLAGIDPLEDCYMGDPVECDYGIYAEFDLGQDIRDGLAEGNSGGDQETVIEEAGPPEDRRLAIRPAWDDGDPVSVDRYMNFAIQDEKLGPTSQAPQLLAICVTYYDDPELAGAQFRPGVYKTLVGGDEVIGFTLVSYNVTLAGTGTWREAYWEIADMKFSGVNQLPQAAARFNTYPAPEATTAKIFFTSIRYAVIRPCGPSAGVNLLADCKPLVIHEVSFDPATGIRVAWPATASDAILQETQSLTAPDWAAVTQTPEEIDGSYVIHLPVTDQTSFYRLTQ